MKKIFFSGLLLILLCSTEIFSQERRLALVIGNADYHNSATLKNPVNDANLMAQTLESLGFEIIKKTNASKVEMEKTIYEFSRKLSEYNVALFYYAGHGIQVNGTNFLIPVDAKLEDRLAAQFEAVDVSSIVVQFERYPDNVNIVILDACRNNPFKTWSRGAENGFTAIPAPSGTIIAFATGEGATASDGNGSNGLYTKALVEQLKKPQRIEDVFIQTRVNVRERSNNTQSPQEWSQLTGKFYFYQEENFSTDHNDLQKTALVKEEISEPVTLDRGLLKSGSKARAHIEDLLNFGYSVLDILDSGVPVRYFYGVNFQGGIIFEIDEEKNQILIAAPFDQARGSKVTFKRAQEVCDQLDYDDFTDWIMPSKAQLELMYINLKEQNFGDFMLSSYWSSTPSGYSNAWGQSFDSGSKYDFDKFSEHYIRAIRVIPLNHN